MDSEGVLILGFDRRGLHGDWVGDQGFDWHAWRSGFDLVGSILMGFSSRGFQNNRFVGFLI